MEEFSLGYVNFLVTYFKRSLVFFYETPGMQVVTRDPACGYASFDTGAARMALAVVPDQPVMVGRHTGITLTAISFTCLRCPGISLDRQQANGRF